MIRLKVSDPHTRLLMAMTVAVFLAMSLLKPGVFLSWNNLRSISFQFPEFALLALAVSVTMLTGGIDLSIVSTALLAASAGAILQTQVFENPSSLAATGLAVAAIFAVGALCGGVNGALIVHLRIPPILATLGTMQLFSGLTIAMTGGTALYGFSDRFLFFGNSSILGLPVPLVIFVLSAGLTGLLLTRTGFGFKLYLLGGNPRAARFSGINSAQILLRTYILSGVLASFAGLIMAARSNSVNADYGASYLLLSILVAVLGGINPDGGFGRISGLVLAVLSLQFIASGLNMLRFSSFAKDLVWGGLLLVVLAVHQAVKNRRNRATGPLVAEDKR